MYSSIQFSKHKFKDLDGKGVRVFEKEPFSIETFEDYFIKTHYSLC